MKINGRLQWLKTTKQHGFFLKCVWSLVQVKLSTFYLYSPNQICLKGLPNL